MKSIWRISWINLFHGLKGVSWILLKQYSINYSFYIVQYKLMTASSPLMWDINMVKTQMIVLLDVTDKLLSCSIESGYHTSLIRSKKWQTFFWSMNAFISSLFFQKQKKIKFSTFYTFCVFLGSFVSLSSDICAKKEDQYITLKSLFSFLKITCVLRH